jgi:hypothetical protein
MDHDYRHLRADQLIKTAERVAGRVKERFADSSLADLAGTVVSLTREALEQAERIQRPNWLLRGVLLALAALVLAGGVAVALSLRGQGTPLTRVMEFMRATSGGAVYLGVVLVFFVTLEIRFKRRKAVRAVHELRALAHIIDMHQLAKDPERLVGGANGSHEPGKVLSAEAMGHYLNYCTELLALVSKIGQLYVQDFPDGTALAAVDHFETLATGLSQKIWQKLMILDRIRAGAPVLPQGGNAVVLTLGGEPSEASEPEAPSVSDR